MVYYLYVFKTKKKLTFIIFYSRAVGHLNGAFLTDYRNNGHLVGHMLKFSDSKHEEKRNDSLVYSY